MPCYNSPKRIKQSVSQCSLYLSAFHLQYAADTVSENVNELISAVGGAKHCVGWTKNDTPADILLLQSFDVVWQRIYRSTQCHRLRFRL